YADLFEGVPPGPVVALHAAGASRMQVFAAAVWPQAAPSVAAYTLYSFECCVRAAAVLGFIGAGGIGYEINLSMRLFEYGQVLTLIMALVGLVAATDFFSRYLRRRLHANAPAGSLAHEHFENERGLRSRADGRTRATIVIFVATIAASFYVTGFFS